MKLIPTSIICLLCLTLANCSPLGPQFRVIQQGNNIDDKQVQKLELGMTTKQVEDIMGTPLSTDLFNPNRTSYVYSLETHRKPLILERVLIDFENDQVVNIAHEVYE